MKDFDIVDPNMNVGDPNVEGQIIHPITPDPLTPLQPAKPIDPIIKAFREYFHELNEIDDKTIEIYKKIALSMVSEARWGDVYMYGVCLLIAHFITYKMTITNDDGSFDVDSNKSVASKSVGSVSISYNTNNEQLDNTFADTVYGREYLTLVKIFGVGAYQL